MEEPVINLFYSTVPSASFKVTKIHFLKNPCLQHKFESSLVVMANQEHENIQSPFNARFGQTAEKTAVLNRLSQHFQRISQNDKIKVLQSWIGISPKNAQVVCHTGIYPPYFFRDPVPLRVQWWFAL